LLLRGLVVPIGREGFAEVGLAVAVFSRVQELICGRRETITRAAPRRSVVRQVDLGRIPSQFARAVYLLASGEVIRVVVEYIGNEGVVRTKPLPVGFQDLLEQAIGLAASVLFEQHPCQA